MTQFDDWKFGAKTYTYTHTDTLVVVDKEPRLWFCLAQIMIGLHLRCFLLWAHFWTSVWDEDTQKVDNLLNFGSFSFPSAEDDWNFNNWGRFAEEINVFRGLRQRAMFYCLLCECACVCCVYLSVCECINRRHKHGEHELSNEYRPRNENNACVCVQNSQQTELNEPWNTHTHMHARNRSVCVCVIQFLFEHKHAPIHSYPSAVFMFVYVIISRTETDDMRVMCGEKRSTWKNRIWCFWPGPIVVLHTLKSNKKRQQNCIEVLFSLLWLNLYEISSERCEVYEKPSANEWKKIRNTYT